MINSNRRVAAIIPARGGSKGIPRKNLIPLCGKPLIEYSIKQAQIASLVDDVIVSTDDKEIAAKSQELGARVIVRSPEAATDTASTESVIQDVIEKIKAGGLSMPEVVVLLQATSPIRRKNDIDNALAQYDLGKCDSLLSVGQSHRFLWRKEGAYFKAINYDYRSRPRRQDFEQYVENGSIYVFSTSGFLTEKNRLFGDIGAYEMPEECNHEIDSVQDLEYIQYLLNALRERDEYDY